MKLNTKVLPLVKELSNALTKAGKIKVLSSITEIDGDNELFYTYELYVMRPNNEYSHRITINAANTTSLRGTLWVEGHCLVSNGLTADEVELHNNLLTGKLEDVVLELTKSVIEYEALAVGY